MPDKEPDTDVDRLKKLDLVLQSLRPSDREMVLAYYRFEGGAKIKNRQCLAVAMNTSLENLAVRVLRARRTMRKRWRKPPAAA